MQVSQQLSWARLLGMACDAARGMLYLHSRSIVHRDLKSANLLVDSSWHVKIAGGCHCPPSSQASANLLQLCGPCSLRQTFSAVLCSACLALLALPAQLTALLALPCLPARQLPVRLCLACLQTSTCPRLWSPVCSPAPSASPTLGEPLTGSMLALRLFKVLSIGRRQ